MNRFEGLSDEELVTCFRRGEDSAMDFIMNKYKKTVRNKAKALYLMGGDEDDLIQEGMIGLFKAVMDFKVDRDASFSTFALLCISRQMYSAVEAALRKKHQPLNSYISFYDEKESTGAGSLVEMELSSEDDNPEVVLIARENEEIIRKTISELLSPLENDVMSLFMEGLDYREIADRLHKSPKSIDNALQRIKNKLYKSKIR